MTEVEGMADFVKVALDAHGGDNAPAEVVKGALLALEENEKWECNISSQWRCCAIVCEKLGTLIQIQIY